MKPIRILTVGMTDTAGGVENFLMTCCGRIDPSRVRFDFLTRYEHAAYPERRQALGQTYHVPLRNGDRVGYRRELRAFFAQHAREYDVIWDNECMFNDLLPLKLAAEYGIPVRIAHSHNPQNVDPTLSGKSKGAAHRVQRRTLSRYANVLWASSEASAKWACPAMDLPCAIIPHAVDVERYRYRADIRAEVRAHYGLEDCRVVGHVGRLQYQKNGAFLLDAFARLHQREPRARLVMVGEGPDLLALEAKAVDLGVSDAVLFLGQRDDVPRLLQAFDVFAMPSRAEGMGMAAVEAQAAGLPCVLSSAYPKEAALTPDVTFLPPENADRWAECLLDVLDGAAERVRPDNTAAITRAGYALDDAAERLTQRFEHLTAEQSAYRRRFVLTGVTAQGMTSAEEDVQRIARDAGYVALTFAAGAGESPWWRTVDAVRTLALWTRLFFRLHHGDLLLVQYPWRIGRWEGMLGAALHLIQWKGAKTAAYVHDLPSLLSVQDARSRWSDQALLPRFDRVLVQNERMAGYLCSQGMPPDALLPVGLPPCISRADIPVRTLSASVCIVGTARPAYAGAIPADIACHVSQWSTDVPLPGAFGLIWAESQDSAYMMLRSPREASLCLTQGMPLIVWKWSGLADTVAQAQLGLVADSLADIPARLTALTDEEYAHMAANARTWGERLRRGEGLRELLEHMK